MNAMRIHRIGPIDEGEPPLRLDRVEVPVPGAGEVLIRVHACGVCHTELDEIEGRTPPPSLPALLGGILRAGWIGQLSAIGAQEPLLRKHRGRSVRAFNL